MDKETKVPTLSKTAVMPSFIYLVTNETDRTVESCFYDFLDAKKECEQWEKMKPQKSFMVVESEIN
jgi:hypothetical protein